MTDEVICWMRHVRAAGLCSRGSRDWCKHHNIDWTHFLAHGIPASTLELTGDPIVARVAQAARKEAAQ